MWGKGDHDTQETEFLDVTKLTVLPKKVLDVPYEGPFRVASPVEQGDGGDSPTPEGPDWKTVEENKTKLGRCGRRVTW